MRHEISIHDENNKEYTKIFDFEREIKKGDSLLLKDLDCAEVFSSEINMIDGGIYLRASFMVIYEEDLIEAGFKTRETIGEEKAQRKEDDLVIKERHKQHMTLMKKLINIGKSEAE